MTLVDGWKSKVGQVGSLKDRVYGKAHYIFDGEPLCARMPGRRVSFTCAWAEWNDRGPKCHYCVDLVERGWVPS